MPDPPAPRDGENELSVKVTNRWPNRLIGDERLHVDDATWNGRNKWRRPVLSSIPDWLAAGLPSPAGRVAFSTCKLWRADDRLLPSGLLGPVRLLRQE